MRTAKRFLSLSLVVAATLVCAAMLKEHLAQRSPVAADSNRYCDVFDSYTGECYHWGELACRSAQPRNDHR